MFWKKKKQEKKKTNYIITQAHETFKLKRADITLTLTDGTVLKENLEESCEIKRGNQTETEYIIHNELAHIYKWRLCNLHIGTDLLYFADKAFPSKNIKLIELTNLQDPWQVKTITYKVQKEVNETK